MLDIAKCVVSVSYVESHAIAYEDHGKAQMSSAEAVQRMRFMFERPDDDEETSITLLHTIHYWHHFVIDRF